GNADRQQLIITAVRNGRPVDVTREAEFRAETPDVIQVSAEGVVTPAGSGTGGVLVTAGGQQARATVRVIDAERRLPVTLEQDVLRVLPRAGCNAGACHGKARGQNGFQLSLLGFDPDFDYAALTQEARGRRLFPAAPEFSLLLRKPTGQVSHGGGKRLQVRDAHYEVLHPSIVPCPPPNPTHPP